MEKITKSSDKVLIDPNEPLILPDGTALVGRLEWFLYALCCLDYQNLPTPMSRIEEFANALITGEIPNIQPQSRAEQFFLAILDGNVSNLPQPQSRSEVLLDKLARGEFDLSDVEPIQSSYELLLAYLIKNGGIGNIDYVLYEFSEAMKTMYNTVEKPFKSLELSGNTLVNCVLEDTENDDYTSFDEDYSGTSFTINGTSEGAIKSAILKGQTLVNSRGNTVSSIGWSTTDGIEYIVEGNNKFLNFECVLLPNTKHLIIFEFDGRGVGVQYGTRPANGAWDTAHMTTTDGICKNIITTGSDSKWLSFIVPNTFTVTDYVKISRIMIIEYQQGMENWDIPYFEGMQSVKLPVLTTTGKNLFDVDNILYNTWVDSTNPNSVGSGNTRNTLDFTKVIPNQTIIASGLTITGAYGYDINKEHVDGIYIQPLITSGMLIPSNVHYIRLTFNNTVDFSNAQLEYGTQATTYEPYKTNILSTPKDLELRGIGEVKDELNVTTGELTQRVGEIVLDGTTTTILGGKTSDTIVEAIIYFDSSTPKKHNMSTNGISDKVITTTSHVDTMNYVRFNTGATNYIIYGILSNQLETADVAGVKKYLQANPITVQYELATPIIKTVDLNVVDQNNTKIDKIHVFDGTTHVNASSDELTPTVNIGKSVSYPTVIKPNTKYTVDLKRNNKPLTVNLGGTEVTFTDGETRKTITTPSTLVNDKLSYYGIGAKCNEIMLIEGEIERNIDYFTGMQSVVMQNQMPILTTSNQRFTILPYEIFENSTPINYQGFTRIDFGLTLTDVMCYIKLNNDMKLKMFIDGFEEVNSNSGISKGVEYSKKLNNISYIGFYNWGDIKFGDGKETILSMLKNGELEIIFSKDGEKKYPYYSNNTKTSILSYSDDVTLHGIENIQDTLDCLTGEVVERIGEIVLDGSEGRWDLAQDRANTMRFNCFNLDIPIGVNGSLLKTDKFPYQSPTANDQEGAVMGGGVVTPRVPSISILKTRLPSNDIDGFKQWLSQNPITVQYRLATESIKIVDLDVVDQDGNAIPKIKSYKDVTHLEVTVPKQSLLPHISAEVATDNSKDMSSLATKHQEISEAQSAIQDNIQFQSDEIDTAMMATTEIFESILE